jgi:PAS domain S-box-containing protein
VKTPLHVLMVEDSEDDARLLVRELTRGGYEVTAERVETAADFIRALDREPWELILSDYALPGFGGGEALRILRESGRDLPFIFVSGTIGEDVAVAAMKAGANDYVMKGGLARLVPAITRELRDAVERRQRREAEVQMRMSEHKYRHLFQSMSDAALLIAEENDRVIDANEQAEILFGQTRDAILGQSGASLFPPLEAGPSRDRDQPAASERETVAHRSDGTLVPVQVSISHIELNRRPLLLALFRDITQHKQAEAELRSSEQRLSTVFKLSPTPIAIVRVSDNRLVDVNTAFCRGTGYSREELVGHTPDELQLWADQGERAAILQEVRDKGVAIARKLHGRRKSGEIGVGLGSLTQIPLNGEPHLLWLILDISEQEQAEQARRESEARFRQVTESIDEVFWLTDPTKNEMIYISPAYQRVWGRTSESLYAQPQSWLEAIHPDDRHRVRSAALTLQASGGYNLEYRIVRPDGAVRWIHDRAFPIRDPDGRVYRIAGVAEDITIKHQLEDQLRQAQKMESLGTLAGGIAHDFNNILTGVLGSAEVARLELPADHPAVAWLQNIALAGLRAKDLVQQILTFGRKHESEMVPRKLQTVVNEALHLLRSTIPTLVQIESRVDPACPPVIADDTQIHQVVMNLCTNAWHALPEQGGRLNVALAPVQVSAEQAATRLGLSAGPYVLLSVSDNGRGMPPEVLVRIFEPFFTTKKQGKGTGLGLAVVHGIVQSHHGAIFVQSTPGRGTLFEVFLPALVAPPIEVTAGSAPATSTTAFERGRGENILLVDDDTTALTGLRIQLEHLGYRVTCASDPRAALERFFSEPGRFDLILTDYAMTEYSGHDLAAKVFAIRPDFPVILTSGLIDAQQSQRARALGIREVIRKPVGTADLARALSLHLAPRSPA